MSGPTPQDLAKALAGQAGLGEPQSVEPLAGGRNNRVYRLGFRDGSSAVLKSYHYDPGDPRDRLKAEWSFLNYVRARGVLNVPTPLASDPISHAAIYSFVSGDRTRAVDGGLIAQAADFAVAINQAPRTPEELAPASEACFSLGSHLDTVDRRVARLRSLDDNAPHGDAARAFVDRRLDAAWQRVRTAIVENAEKRGVSLDAPAARQIVSPSDFGFHNALIDAEGRATFLDFEYAGRDDPAKLICDFFCQPELTPPLQYYPDFTGRLAIALGLDEADLWRAGLLLDAYRVKWVCIMLNEFLPVGARRRAFASQQDSESRAAHQLRGAERYLDLITS